MKMVIINKEILGLGNWLYTRFIACVNWKQQVAQVSTMLLTHMRFPERRASIRAAFRKCFKIL
jgi:hypothetical protein